MTTSAPFGFLLALAQTGPGGGLGSLAPLLVQFALIVGILYFIMIRPQQKQRQKHEAALRDLKKGDEIVTTGGLVGEVLHIREATRGETRAPMDDRITIKSGESRVVVERGRIARIVEPSGASQTT
jgi:preprotein translocase subunit YajC